MRVLRDFAIRLSAISCVAIFIVVFEFQFTEMAVKIKRSLELMYMFEVEKVSTGTDEFLSIQWVDGLRTQKDAHPRMELNTSIAGSIKRLKGLKGKKIEGFPGRW